MRSPAWHIGYRQAKALVYAKATLVGVSINALVLCLLAAACAAPPTRDDILQSAIEAGRLACMTALNDQRTVWGPGAQAYCEGVVNGCSK